MTVHPQKKIYRIRKTAMILVESAIFVFVIRHKQRNCRWSFELSFRKNELAEFVRIFITLLLCIGRESGLLILIDDGSDEDDEGDDEDEPCEGAAGEDPTAAERETPSGSSSARASRKRTLTASEQFQVGNR